MAVTVIIEQGTGAWKRFTLVQLVAAPHVGDAILVGEEQIECDAVLIGKFFIHVSETCHWDHDTYEGLVTQPGWGREWPADQIIWAATNVKDGKGTT